MSEARFRTLVIALAVLNIFVISALAGAVFTLVTKAEPQASLMPLAGERLPPPQRQAFQRALGEARRAARETRLDGQQAKLDVAAILGQPTLDQAALIAALTKARQDDFAMREKIESKAAEFVATLPLDDRRKLAQGLLARIAPKPPATK